MARDDSAIVKKAWIARRKNMGSKAGKAAAAAASARSAGAKLRGKKLAMSPASSGRAANKKAMGAYRRSEAKRKAELAKASAAESKKIAGIRKRRAASKDPATIKVNEQLRTSRNNRMSAAAKRQANMDYRAAQTKQSFQAQGEATMKRAKREAERKATQRGMAAVQRNVARKSPFGPNSRKAQAAAQGKANAALNAKIESKLRADKARAKSDAAGGKLRGIKEKHGYPLPRGTRHTSRAMGGSTGKSKVVPAASDKKLQTQYNRLHVAQKSINAAQAKLNAVQKSNATGAKGNKILTSAHKALSGAEKKYNEAENNIIQMEREIGRNPSRRTKVGRTAFKGRGGAAKKTPAQQARGRGYEKNAREAAARAKGPTAAERKATAAATSGKAKRAGVRAKNTYEGKKGYKSGAGETGGKYTAGSKSAPAKRAPRAKAKAAPSRKFLRPSEQPGAPKRSPRPTAAARKAAAAVPATKVKRYRAASKYPNREKKGFGWAGPNQGGPSKAPKGLAFETRGGKAKAPSKPKAPPRKRKASTTTKAALAATSSSMKRIGREGRAGKPVPPSRPSRPKAAMARRKAGPVPSRPQTLIQKQTAEAMALGDKLDRDMKGKTPAQKTKLVSKYKKDFGALKAKWRK